MARVDNRQWYKIRLIMDDQLTAILASWKGKTPTHLIRAIYLYDSLRVGDFDKFMGLLKEFFPGVALGMRMSGQFQVESVHRPQPIVGSLKIQDQTVRTIDEMVESSGDQFGFGSMFDED